MKKNTEILNLPIISIREGKELAKVKDMVLSKDLKKVEWIVFEELSDDIMIEKVIPFQKVVGIGDYAMMIQDMEDIISPFLEEIEEEPEEEIITEKIVSRKGNIVRVISEYPISADNKNKIDDDFLRYAETRIAAREKQKLASEISRQIKGRVDIRGKKVITSKGRMLGEILYYSLDEESGVLIEYVAEKIDKSSPITFLSSDIITLGESFIIVQDQVMTVVEPEILEDNDITRKREKSLVGKTTVKDLTDESGNVLVYSGTELTKDIIEEAKNMGDSYFTELFFVV